MKIKNKNPYLTGIMDYLLSRQKITLGKLKFSAEQERKNARFFNFFNLHIQTQKKEQEIIALEREIEFFKNFIPKAEMNLLS